MELQSVTDLTEKGVDAAVETTGTLTERVTDGAKRVSDSVVEAGKEVVGQGAEVVHDARRR